MNRIPAPKQTAERVERLLRSLVGVADLRPAWNRSGCLCQVHILKEDDVQHHQLTRNVISALQAGFGIRLDPLNVSVYRDPSLFAAAVERIRSYATVDATVAAGASVDVAANGCAAAAGTDVLAEVDIPSVIALSGKAEAPTEAAEPPVSHEAAGASAWAGIGAGSEAVGAGIGAGLPAILSTVLFASEASGSGAPYRNGAATAGVSAPTLLVAPSNGDGHAPYHNGNGHATAAVVARGAVAARDVQEPVSATESAAGTMMLERLDVERHSGALRCHVVLLLGARRYSAIAEVPDGPAVEAELAATVTLDALRAGALTCARLDGIGFTSIGDTTYLVAAIRDASGTAKRASAAPLAGSMARSAAYAVLSAVGPITAARQLSAERQLGRL
jgi:hypothetical protein